MFHVFGEMKMVQRTQSQGFRRLLKGIAVIRCFFQTHRFLQTSQNISSRVSKFLSKCLVISVGFASVSDRYLMRWVPLPQAWLYLTQRTTQRPLMGKKKQKSTWIFPDVCWMGKQGVPIHHPGWFKQHLREDAVMFEWICIFLCERWRSNFFFKFSLSSCLNKNTKALRQEQVSYFLLNWSSLSSVIPVTQTTS